MEETAAPSDQALRPKRFIATPWQDLEHQLTHLPAHPECPICQLAKITRAPARPVKPHMVNKAKAFGERIHVDLIGPVVPDVLGHRHALTVRD